jgi:hypothetical protein
MKRIFLTLIAAVSMIVTTNAQVNFGAKAGLNLYKIAVDEGDASDLKAGIHLGVLAHIHLTEQMAVQPELVYSMQGAKSEIGGDKVTLNLNYLNIPVLLQYMFDNGFRVEAGPQIGVLASAKSKFDDNSVDVKDSFNSIDFSVPLGIGYISPNGFGVDARYNIGLSNVNENDDSKAWNRGFQIGVFYQFQHE